MRTRSRGRPRRRIATWPIITAITVIVAGAATGAWYLRDIIHAIRLPPTAIFVERTTTTISPPATTTTTTEPTTSITPPLEKRNRPNPDDLFIDRVRADAPSPPNPVVPRSDLIAYGQAVCGALQADRAAGITPEIGAYNFLNSDPQSDPDRWQIDLAVWGAAPAYLCPDVLGYWIRILDAAIQIQETARGEP